MTEPDWVAHAIWWQVYPLGFVGAFPADPAHPAQPEQHRLARITDWLDHAVALGASGIALGPVFASRTHGYDTTDYFCIDPRLGTEADFDALVREAHNRGMRVLLDGVFNHVGTDFAHYRAAMAGDEQASTWFRGRPGAFRTFEGHDDLPALQHRNPAVADFVVQVLNYWLDRGADGWRLDAAYAVPAEFWASVLPRVRARHPDAWFVGEVIHGDYADVVARAGFDAVTQYELWKAIWSSLNDANLHELDWALRRHDTFLDTFVPQTFIGNHDVTRIASQLTDPRHVPVALVLLLTVGGVPTVYAGDEFGFRGIKEERRGGDDAIRPQFGAPPLPVDADGAALFALHQFLIGLRRRHPWLHTARTHQLALTNSYYLYRTQAVDDPSQGLLVAINLTDHPRTTCLAEVGHGVARVLAGTGAPPDQVLDTVVVPAHGWLILQPEGDGAV